MLHELLSTLDLMSIDLNDDISNRYSQLQAIGFASVIKSTEAVQQNNN